MSLTICLLKISHLPFKYHWKHVPTYNGYSNNYLFEVRFKIADKPHGNVPVAIVKKLLQPCSDIFPRMRTTVTVRELCSIIIIVKIIKRHRIIRCDGGVF